MFFIQVNLYYYYVENALERDACLFYESEIECLISSFLTEFWLDETVEI